MSERDPVVTVLLRGEDECSLRTAEDNIRTTRGRDVSIFEWNSCVSCALKDFLGTPDHTAVKPKLLPPLLQHAAATALLDESSRPPLMFA